MRGGADNKCVLTLPSALQELIHRLARMPGVGPRSAERIALGMLDWDAAELDALASGLRGIAGRVTPCPRCAALSQDGAECSVCGDPRREATASFLLSSVLQDPSYRTISVFAEEYSEPVD